MASPNENEALAYLLGETADLLEAQEADPFRVQAYRRAAETVRRLDVSIRSIEESRGRAGLIELPAIGESLARTIETWLHTGTLGILVRLRGDQAAEEAVATLGGVGPKLAHRLVHDLGIHSLEELEIAAADGRLARIPGVGPSRLRSIRDQLEARLRRRPNAPSESPETSVASLPLDPPVAEILGLDRDYRSASDSGSLPMIAPRRMNPTGEAWLPILHRHVGGRHFTVLFSNTPRAHELGRVRDWVVVYLDDGRHHRQWTVVTERRGALAGRRVVRGREPECLEYYRERKGTGQARDPRSSRRRGSSRPVARERGAGGGGLRYSAR